MPSSPSESAIVARLAARHPLSEDAVRTVLSALRAGGGTMAQFSHPEFGGMSQWSSGMTMVGDMFNDDLRAKLNALAADLAGYLRENPTQAPAEKPHSYRSRGDSGQPHWWPEAFGTPSSTGVQNSLRYAVFPQTRRLVIEDHGKLMAYDTGDHLISGVAQAQSQGSTLTFVSQKGVVPVTGLRTVRV